jgi:multicomponent Na+:H+ antiporter subunit E
VDGLVGTVQAAVARAGHFILFTDLPDCAPHEEIFPPRFSYGLRLVGYWFWLGREIFRSGLDVTRVILDPKMPISPREVTITANPPSSMDQVIFANSITLTPGTLALDLHNGVIKVHCLTEDGAKQLLDGEMDRRVTELSSR